MAIIHGSSKTGDTKALFAAIQSGININELDMHGRPPLYWAAKNGHIRAVEMLLKFNANVNATCQGTSSALSGEVGLTPLMIAAWTGRFEVVRVLLEHGADVLAKSVDGYNALYFAKGSNWTDIVDLLIQAVECIDAKKTNKSN